VEKSMQLILFKIQQKAIFGEMFKNSYFWVISKDAILLNLFLVIFTSTMSQNCVLFDKCVGYVQKVLKPFFKKIEICVNSETLWTTVLEK
jgi:hypothetical protein